MIPDVCSESCSCFSMDPDEQLCHSFGLPVWMASLLHAARRLRSDRARRKKVYRLLHRKLMFDGVGLREGRTWKPTYVYPEQVKLLMRSAFPEDVCDYPDPRGEQVVYVTMQDLRNISSS